jgi:hypothetical protein
MRWVGNISWLFKWAAYLLGWLDVCVYVSCPCTQHYFHKGNHSKSLSSLVMQVDATQEADLGQKYGVNGYPTIKWFVDGEVAMDYSGSRDA